jgi:hypothetical protein
VQFPLYVRIPGWCKQAAIRVNGDLLPSRPDGKGFVKIARTWSAGDLVELKLPMAPRILRGFETEFPAADRGYFAFEPPAVFKPRRLPYASVLYGPLLFSLAIPDIDPNTPAKDVRWQFALDVLRCQEAAGEKQSGEAAACDLAVQRKAMPAHWDWPLDAPLWLTAPARAFDWKPSDAQALPDRPVTGQTRETIRLVPYGCTKFRISMFPVASP